MESSLQLNAYPKVTFGPALTTHSLRAPSCSVPPKTYAPLGQGSASAGTGLRPRRITDSLLSWALLVLFSRCGQGHAVPHPEPQFPHPLGFMRMWSAWVNAWLSLPEGEPPRQKLGPSSSSASPPSLLPPQPLPGRAWPTLCREKVRTQNVASSMVSSSVTWMKP